MKESPLKIKLERISRDYVCYQDSPTTFFVKKGHKLNVVASKDESSHHSYTVLITSTNDLPLVKRSSFQLFLLFVSVVLAISALFPWVFDMHTSLSKVKKEKEKLSFQNTALLTQIDSIQLINEEIDTLLGEQDEVIDSLGVALDSVNQAIEIKEKEFQRLTYASPAQKMYYENKIRRLEDQSNEIRNQRDLAIQQKDLLQDSIHVYQRNLMESNHIVNSSKEELAESRIVLTLIEETLQSMELFYTNTVLLSRNYDHAIQALDGFDILINEYKKEEFRVLRDQFYEEVKDGVDR